MTVRMGDSGPRSMLVVASWLVLVAMLSSFTPTPLYPLYQERWGTSATWVSVAFAAYPIGVLVVLLGLGGLSDRWGRRPTLGLATAVIGLSAVVMALAWSPGVVVVGRVLQGFGTALTTGAAAAALMELHPRGTQAGSALNTVALSVGCAIGPWSAGLLAQHSPLPTVAPYLLVGGLLVVPAVLLARMTPGAPATSRVALVRRIRVPPDLLRPFALAGLAVMFTNSVMGVFGSFGSQLAGDVGFTGEAAAGRLVSVVFIALAAAQILTQRRTAARSIATGMTLCVGGWVVVSVATSTGAAVTMVVGAALVGAGSGLTLMGSAALVGAISPLHMRAELYSAYLLVAFSVLGCTALLAGGGLERWGVDVFTRLVAGVLIALAVLAWRLGRGVDWEAVRAG